MDLLNEARDKIVREVTTIDPEVINSFLALYKDQIDAFVENMAKSMVAWNGLEAMLINNEKIVYVVNIAYCAIMLNVQSLKLFLSGHQVASGNLLRQVLESVSMALLCSGKSLPILDQFLNDRYSTKNAVRDVRRYSADLGLRKEGVLALANAEGFYHKFSHFSKLTVGVSTSFSEQGLYVGASFDEAKIKGYDSEIKNRLNLSSVFPNFLAAVSRNLSSW